MTRATTGRLVAESATPVPPMPEGWPHRVRGGGRRGRHHCHAPGIRQQDRLHTIETVSSPVSPLERTIVLRVEPAAPRESVEHPPARSPEGKRTAWTVRGVLDFLASGTTAEAIAPVCSAAFREVGGRRRGDPQGRRVDRVSVRHPG